MLYEEGTAVSSDLGLSARSCEGVSGEGGDGDDEGIRREPRGVVSSLVSGGSVSSRVVPHGESASRRSFTPFTCMAPESTAVPSGLPLTVALCSPGPSSWLECAERLLS